MSNIRDLCVGEIIQILQNTYRCIDLRAGLLKEKKEWECIFLILRTTVRNKGKIESLHENKRLLIRSEHPHVQFVYESRDITDINSILHQINDGHIEIGTYKAKIENAGNKEANKKKTQTANSYVVRGRGNDTNFILTPYCDLLVMMYIIISALRLSYVVHSLPQLA
jgi:hypothetical protein